MPREARTKTKRHAPAPQFPSKASSSKQKLVPAHSTEPTRDPEELVPTRTPTGSGIFGIAPPREVTKPLIGNRAKAANLPTLPTHPYSRSHLKREKRKAARQAFTGAMASALSSVEHEDEDEDEFAENSETAKRPAPGTLAAKAVASMKAKPKPVPKDGMIREGKGLSMKEKKKRKQIAIEAQRIPAILQHPAYKADPWATIRLHANNTLELKSAIQPQRSNESSARSGRPGDEADMEL